MVNVWLNSTRILTEKRGAAVLIHCSSRSTQSASVACTQQSPVNHLPHFTLAHTRRQFQYTHHRLFLSSFFAVGKRYLMYSFVALPVRPSSSWAKHFLETWSNQILLVLQNLPSSLREGYALHGAYLGHWKKPLWASVPQLGWSCCSRVGDAADTLGLARSSSWRRNDAADTTV